MIAAATGSQGRSADLSEDESASYSAQGTRLNKRGLETRRHILDVAVAVLAAGGPESASVNFIAREAGLTWGTIQHQFGDVDGVWAALLEHAREEARHRFPSASTDSGPLRQRVTQVVDAGFASHSLPSVQAIMNLRLSLPRDPEALEESYPATAATLRAWVQDWADRWDGLFEGLGASEAKMRRVRSLVPAAVRGLQLEQEMTTFDNLEDGRKGLIDAVVCYLA
jgi:AcrR family transcriptional regulator